MRSLNTWLSAESIKWEDPAICPEEALMLDRTELLRKLAVDTCVKLPNVNTHHFLEFIDFIERDSYTYPDVMGLLEIMAHIMEVLSTEFEYREAAFDSIDLDRWNLLFNFCLAWGQKVERVQLAWENELRFKLN